MPRKKAVSPPRTVLSKREFIDALPDVISIGALLSRAKQSGVRISKSYAYSLLAGRKKTNSKNPAAKDGAQDALRAGSKENKSPPRATPPRRSAPAARATSPVSAPAPTDAETQFLSLAVDLGLHRSQELLDRLRSRVRTLVG